LTFRDAEYRRLFDYLKNFGFENETEVVMPGTNAQMQFGIGPKFLLSSRAPASCGFIAEAVGTVVQLALLRRSLDFRTQCKASIVAMAISGISAVWMAWRGYGVWSLAAQALIYTTASTGLIWAFCPWKPALRFRVESLRSLFGYGRFDAQYIEHLKTASQRSLAVQCEFIDHLLPPDQFDMLIDSCDALLLASRDQRELYSSIYRYLAAGKPVFLPKDAELRRDLQDLGFQVEALESLGTMNASVFSDLCRRKCEVNVRVARECLGMEAIRRTWAKVILAAGS